MLTTGLALSACAMPGIQPKKAEPAASEKTSSEPASSPEKDVPPTTTGGGTNGLPPQTSTGSADVVPSGAPAIGNAAVAGKTFKFGQAVPISAEVIDKRVNVTISVDRIEKGKATDYTYPSDQAKASGQTPYYVHYTVTRLQGGDTLKEYEKPLLSLDGKTSSGAPVKASYLGPNDKCRYGTLSSKTFAVGTSYKTCEQMQTPVESTLTEAVFKGRYKDSTYEKPVTWK